MSLLPYTLCDVREEAGLYIIELWAEPRIVYHTVRCLTLESSYGLESSVVYNLQHAILRFSPRAYGYRKHVQWFLDYWAKELEKEHEADMDEKFVPVDADRDIQETCKKCDTVKLPFTEIPPVN